MYRCALERSSGPSVWWRQDPVEKTRAGGREVRQRSNHRTLDFRVIASGCGRGSWMEGCRGQGWSLRLSDSSIHLSSALRRFIQAHQVQGRVASGAGNRVARASERARSSHLTYSCRPIHPSQPHQTHEQVKVRASLQPPGRVEQGCAREGLPRRRA